MLECGFFYQYQYQGPQAIPLPFYPLYLRNRAPIHKKIINYSQGMAKKCLSDCIWWYYNLHFLWYTLFCLKLLRFVWIKTCLYFFDNDEIMFDYDHICLFDTAIFHIFMLETVLMFLFVLLFIPNHVMYFVIPFLHNHNLYIDKYLLWKFCMGWCLFWWGCVVFRSRFPLEEGGNYEYGCEITFL